MINKVENVPGVDRNIWILGSGIKINKQASAIDAPPPSLGQNTSELLQQIGYTQEEIATFRKDGIL
jgi:CoA:oxalate CoA-transferase